jgi:predicted nucleic acid-binding protein
MVLVDTSVWIRYLAGRQPFADGLRSLLEREAVAAHDLVFGELLIGDCGGRRSALLSRYACLHPARIVAHGEVVLFVRGRKLSGRGLGWVDVHLLASAIVSGIRLWTADESLAGAARDLGVHYAP